MTVRARIRAEYVAMTLQPGDVERVFRDVGALQDGHFVLTSGRHSAVYLEKFRLLERPRETERLCAAIAAWARTLDVATVAGPTTGGVILAYEIARQLGARAVYAERRNDGAGRELRRGFALAPGERVLVVDDVLTTGGSLQETIAAISAAGGSVVGAAVLVDRSGGARSDVPVHALWRVDIATYAPSECPQCAAGMAATHPGTGGARGSVVREGRVEVA
jgi:orotate phosphoribosyltransferase